MKLVYFAHSLASCWNHGNAHFLRGVLRDLQKRGHDVLVLEPASGWSRENLVKDQGETALQAFVRDYPDLKASAYDGPDVDRLLDGADAVIVHEWTDHAVVEQIARIRRIGAPFQLLFHDTHHRAASEPDTLPLKALEDFDAVLAFGESLSKIYRGWGWGSRVFTWHEAADTTQFYPRPFSGKRDGVVWIGNWGDGERTEELEQFLFRPVRRAAMTLDIHGVRYPPEALRLLEEVGANYKGWLANAAVPEVFARYLCTVHVPRRLYIDKLPGIPTIRMFEALACGIPLVSKWWPDEEHLFREGQDYLVARNGGEVETHLRRLANDPELRASLIESGLDTICARHTCHHRVDELLDVLQQLGVRAAQAETV